MVPVRPHRRIETRLMAEPSPTSTDKPTEEVPAGCMPPWHVGELPPPLPIRWNPGSLIGPGLLMVGAAIGGGEWLMGPAATAQYGGIIMTLAMISILCQVVYNLEVQRYALYCGEPIFVGFFRLRPGPRFWTILYLFIDFFGVWPYLAANAATPLHAAILGHMPGESDQQTTHLIGYGIFLLALVPLIFGGKAYNSLEKVMTIKVVLVLAYLLFLAFFYVSWQTWAEVFGGFAFFGKDASGQWGFRLLPDVPGVPWHKLDWALLGTFAAIAGVGGLNNSQLSTYAREKGWGMGARVGAVPSMIGGRGISLSHTGKIFRITPESLRRWFGWLRFIRRDQWVIWMIGCILGMAIPSLLSLEYLRGVKVAGNEVPAKTAEALTQYTGNQAFWFMTLFCGFLVLGPTQTAQSDGLLRRWTDVLWTGNPKLQKMEGHAVKYVYYSLLAFYAVWGLVVLTWLGKYQLLMVKVNGVPLNFALGFSAFQTLAVNMIFLPKELRPGWPARLGLVACGVYFIGIAVLAVPGAMAELRQAGLLNWLGL